jgi:2-polyprenyl-6-methoxyphenol hydroxylase-like FAD-dependent oxidoreductase
MGGLRVLISGAGIAGPSLAHRLVGYGYEPTLIERAPAFRDGGYMIDIWGVGFDILERYRLVDAARQRGYLFDELRFVDSRGKTLSSLGGAVFRRALGERFFSIPRGELARVLYETVEKRTEVLFGTTVQALHQGAAGVDVQLSSGESRQFDVVIAADGLHSRVRELAFGPERQFERYLGYLAASFVAENYPHRDEGAYVSFARPARQVSRYAMRDHRTAFLLVFAAESGSRIRLHSSAAQKDFLRARFAEDGWEVPEILRCLESVDDLYFDAVSQIRMPRWARGRIALVGDAAHCPSLLAGAGAAFAMLGAYILAEELDRADGDWTKAFPEYERRLRRYMLRQQRAAMRFAGFFAPRTSLGIRVRDGAINLMSAPGIGSRLLRRMFANAFPLTPE